LIEVYGQVEKFCAVLTARRLTWPSLAVTAVRISVIDSFFFTDMPGLLDGSISSDPPIAAHHPVFRVEVIGVT
jgi:hypothetical protein